MAARTSRWCWSATTARAGCRPCSRGWPASWRRSRTRSRSTPAARTTAPSCSPRRSAATAWSTVPSSTSFPAALRAGLAHLDQLGADTEWVWVLHDDASPHPEALLALLAGAADDPDADVLGPMLREWPSLKRLLELGVTISGTGPARDRAGARASTTRASTPSRARCWPSTPPGCWSAAGCSTSSAASTTSCRSSATTSTSAGGPRRPATGPWSVPQAVVFHAEAAHRGLRRTPLTGRHTHYQERRAALFTLLANSALAGLAAAGWSGWRSGRWSGCSASWRSARPGQALDDLAAYVSVVASPRDLLAARRARRAAADRRPARRSSGLLAPRWLPYRHGLDAVGDLATALTQQASDVAERRRAAAAERDPSSFAARRTERARAARGRRDGRGHRDRGPVPHQPGRGAARRSSWSRCSSAPARRWATCPGPGSRRRPTSWRDWWSLHLVLVARARPRHRGPGAAVRAADGAAGHRPRAPARRPRSRRCWCSRCRSRCGGPGGSCGWPAGWPRRRARTAG